MHGSGVTLVAFVKVASIFCVPISLFVLGRAMPSPGDTPNHMAVQPPLPSERRRAFRAQIHVNRTSQVQHVRPRDSKPGLPMWTNVLADHQGQSLDQRM